MGSRKLRTLWSCLAVSTALGCSSIDSDRTGHVGLPITNGTPDEGHLAVVGVVSGGEVACTGTLVSERVVLTAAHCLGDTPTAVVFGASEQDALAVVPVAGKRAHDEFDLLAYADDVGMLVLSEAPPAGVEPMPMSVTPMGPGDVGASIRLVGWGVETAGGVGDRKLQGSTVITAVEDKVYRYEPAPSQSCDGDSGGAGLREVAGHEVLIGVISSGDAMCTGGAKDTRVDVYADFIRPYLEQTAVGVAPLGAICHHADNCEEGECRAPSTMDALAYCTHRCDGGQACPDGMQCVGEPVGERWCRLPAPEPGQLDSPCDEPFDCTSLVCARPSEDATYRCSVRCFPENQPPCPDGMICDVNPDRPTRHACFRPESSPDAGGADAGPEAGTEGNEPEAGAGPRDAGIAEGSPDAGLSMRSDAGGCAVQPLDRRPVPGGNSACLLIVAMLAFCRCWGAEQYPRRRRNRP